MGPVGVRSSCRRASRASKAGLAAFGAVLASLLGWAAPPLHGECSRSTGDTGFADVVFDRTAGTFDGVLPFDVPVRICAEVPEGTTRATVKYATNLRRRGPLDIDPDCNIRTPGVVWSPESVRAPNGTTVRWLIDRLKAERYYAFCFGFEKKATDDEIAAFRTQARAALDEGIGQLRSATLTPDETQRICTDLRGRLLAVTGTDQILTRGTVFDCDPAQVGAFAARITRGVLDPQRRAQVILEGRPASGAIPATPGLAQRQADLQAELAAIQGTPALSHLAELVEQQAALDATVGARVQSLCPGCAAFLGPAAAPAAQLAAGADTAGTAPPPLTPSSDPAQAEAMARSYAATAETLDGLGRLIAWVQGDGAAAVGAGLDDAERAALAASGGPLEKASGLATTLAGLSQNLATQLAARAQALAARADELAVDARSLQLADASTLGNFATRQTNYVSLDAGFVWAPELDEVVPYAGTNIYLRPVNKNAPLASLGSFGQTFTRRFAFTLALTASSIADSNDAAGTARDDLFGSQSLLAGAGLRITDSIRVGAGAMVFKRLDPNPLVDESQLYSSYYLSLSFDIDMVRLFSRNLGGVLTPTTSGGGGGQP